MKGFLKNKKRYINKLFEPDSCNLNHQDIDKTSYIAAGIPFFSNTNLRARQDLDSNKKSVITGQNLLTEIPSPEIFYDTCNNYDTLGQQSFGYNKCVDSLGLYASNLSSDPFLDEDIINEHRNSDDKLSGHMNCTKCKYDTNRSGVNSKSPDYKKNMLISNPGGIFGIGGKLNDNSFNLH